MDAVFFNGANDAGFYFAAGIARRNGNFVQMMCMFRVSLFSYHLVHFKHLTLFIFLKMRVLL